MLKDFDYENTQISLSSLDFFSNVYMSTHSYLR